MKMRSVAPMRVAKIGYIVLSIVFCIVGITMIVVPDISINVIGNVLGISMIVFGLIKLIGYFSKDLYRLAFQYDLEFGILLFILGIIIFVKPGNILNLICVALGVAIIADGLFKIKIAMESHTFGIKSWWLILALSILSCLFGLLLIFRPSEAARVVTIILGSSLFAEGILNFSVAVSMVKIIKHQLPEVIESDSYEFTRYTNK